MIVPKLRLTVPFHSDETPVSYVSRLAVRNGTRADPFCKHFELRLMDLADGDEKSLRSLAALGGIKPEPLLANAIIKSGPFHWTFREEPLDRTALRRVRLAVCPACALADIKAHPELLPQSAAYGRAAWLLDIVRLCPIHRIPMVFADQTDSVRLRYDFAQQVRLLFPRLIELAAVPPQDVSPLQNYALRRLVGGSGGGLLDTMRIGSAVRLSETTGAIALFPDLDAKQLSAEQRDAAGAAGYNAFAGGAESFRSLMARLKDSVDGRARLDSPSVLFGKLYLLLARTDNPEYDAEYDVVRRIMREYILANFAIDGGQSILGKTVGRRRLHSLQTLARQTSVHPKVLRRHLRAAGLVTAEQMKMSDHNVLFDADAAVAVAAPLANALSAADAMEHLNAPRSQMALIIERGFVQARHRAASSGGQDRYASADLDAFLLKLGINSPVVRGHSKFRSIPDTAKRCCRSAADVIQLILDQRLETKTASGVRGYLGILVDPDQAIRALRGEDNTGFSLWEAARGMRISDRVLAALIAHEHIATFLAANPVNRRPQKLISVEAVEQFREGYISLFRLAKERNVPIATMKAALDEAGVIPAFDHKQVFARLYRTADLTGKAIGDGLLRPTPKVQKTRSPLDKPSGKRTKLRCRQNRG